MSLAISPYSKAVRREPSHRRRTGGRPGRPGPAAPKTQTYPPNARLIRRALRNGGPDGMAGLYRVGSGMSATFDLYQEGRLGVLVFRRAPIEQVRQGICACSHLFQKPSEGQANEALPEQVVLRVSRTEEKGKKVVCLGAEGSGLLGYRAFNLAVHQALLEAIT